MTETEIAAMALRAERAEAEVLELRTQVRAHQAIRDANSTRIQQLRDMHPKKGIDYPGVCVSFFCHDGRRLLWQLRSAKCRNAQGKWDVGAGGVNVGETFRQACLREVSEEYGVLPYGSSFPLELGTREAIWPDGHWVARDFLVRVDPALVRIAEPDMVDELRWLDFGITPDRIHRALPPIIDRYFREIPKLLEKVSVYDIRPM